MTMALKNFLRIHPNAKLRQMGIDVMAMNHHLKGIIMRSFLKHRIVLTILLRELVGDIFKRGGGGSFMIPAQLTLLIDLDPCTRTHRSEVVHVLPFLSHHSVSILPFLSHEVVLLCHMQQSAVALFTNATAEGSAV
jgi:hypothetical protein